jgi:hypothetical protein
MEKEKIGKMKFLGKRERKKKNEREIERGSEREKERGGQLFCENGAGLVNSGSENWRKSRGGNPAGFFVDSTLGGRWLCMFFVLKKMAKKNPLLFVLP